MSDGGTLPVTFDVASLRSRLRPKEALFVAHHLGGMSALDAVRAAGYVARTDGAAKAKGWKLLHANPRVKAAIDEAKAELARRNDFSMDRAMQQLRQDRQFAIETRNATAAVRATELMSKMSGHLDERPLLNLAPFQIIVEGL